MYHIHIHICVCTYIPTYMFGDIACFLLSSSLCVCTLKSGFLNQAANSRRARLCGLRLSYPLPQLDQHGGCNNYTVHC